MPLHKDWQELKEISSLKRAAENPPPFTTRQDRKALKVEAQALAHLETQKQWDIRAQATQFLKEHGYTSGAKKINVRKIPGL